MKGALLLRRLCVRERYIERVKGKFCVGIATKDSGNCFEEEEEGKRWLENDPHSIRKERIPLHLIPVRDIALLEVKAFVALY